MQGIDISSYQAGIDLASVPCDFVIVKATQGTGYVNPDCTRAVEQALAAGKLVGVYHYVSGGNATAEAEYFHSVCQGWDARAMWCVDWEAGSNTAWGDLGYLEQLCRRLADLCGRKLMLYASAAAFPWQLCEALGMDSWVAQYANMNATGYQDHPCDEGAYQCDIRQYSATGRLPGWGGDLDLNKSYITAADWAAYTGGADDMQLTDTVRRPDGHESTVGDILAWLDQRLERLDRITRPDGKTVDLATIAAYNDQRLERLEHIIAGGGIDVLNTDGTSAGRQTDLATEAAWNSANVLRLLAASGVSDEQIDKIKQAIVDAKIQISVVGPTPAVEGGDAA